jgi:Flp pilus assembly protein TadD
MKEALRLNPKDAYASAHRGLGFAHKGRCDPAITALTEAIPLRPDDAEFYANRA